MGPIFPEFRPASHIALQGGPGGGPRALWECAGATPPSLVAGSGDVALGRLRRSG
jgi:hypothetical protein